MPSALARRALLARPTRPLYRCTSLCGLKQARRREVSVDRLIRDLLDIIVDDKLTTAILDD
jgi:hypothetical protein